MDKPTEVSENPMELPKEDRRRRRTRQLLRSALLGLLEHKKYEDITVQDIIAQADVGRSTFYMHYQHKDDLLLGPEGLFAEHLTRQVRYELNPRDLDSVLSARVWLEHLGVQRPVLKAIGGSSALGLATQTLAEMLQDDYLSRVRWLASPVPPEVIAEYLVSTLMVLIGWWLQTDSPRTPQQMDELFMQLVQPGLRRVLGLKI